MALIDQIEIVAVVDHQANRLDKAPAENIPAPVQLFEPGPIATVKMRHDIERTASHTPCYRAADR